MRRPFAVAVAWAGLQQIGGAMAGGAVLEQDYSRRMRAARRGNRRGHRTLAAKALARRLGSR